MIVLTCEHAGNRVPPAYRHLFTSLRARRALDSHRGYDPGARWLARRIKTALAAPLVDTDVTRLLVETNKSVGHGRLFSEFSRRLPAAERDRVVDTWYRPHRNRVTAAIRAALDDDRTVVHIGVHSFTPRLRGRTRNADIGLLYDPGREAERHYCLAWQAELKAAMPSLRIRRNYPYRGRDDGLTTHLRCVFAGRPYLGIELEVNQRLLTGPRRQREAVATAVIDSLRAIPAGCRTSAPAAALEDR